MNTEQIFQHNSSKQAYKLIPIFLLFVFLFLATSCGDSGQLTNDPPMPGSIRLLLIPKPDGTTPSHSEMEETRQILDQRIHDMGLKESSRLLSTNGLSIQIDMEPPQGNAQATIDNLLKTGLLEFWLTGTTPLNAGDLFDPIQYTQYNPGNKPYFTGQDLAVNSLGVSQQSNGEYQIDFAMKSNKAADFGTFTSNNIGQYMTITLDKQVVTSATIQTAITGPGEITGGFTQAQAQNIVSTLKYGALPVVLQIDSEQTL